MKKSKRLKTKGKKTQILVTSLKFRRSLLFFLKEEMKRRLSQLKRQKLKSK